MYYKKTESHITTKLLSNKQNLVYVKHIHVNSPGSSGSLPEMWPDSRTPGSEPEPPGCENSIKKKKIFFFFLQTIIYAYMYGNNGHLLLEGN